MQRFKPTIRTHASTMVLVLAGALGSLGVSGEAQAIGMSAFPVCSGPVGDRTSEVFSNTTPAGSGFSYNFKICNTSESYGELIRDWEIPYNAAAGVTGITQPNGWSYSIETIGTANPNTGWDGEAHWQDGGDPNDPNDNDPMYDAFPAFRVGSQVLHWYTSECFQTGELPSQFQCDSGDAFATGDSREGFMFISDLSPNAGPYQASWIDLPPRTGDPDVPGGNPATGGAFRASVPEPGGFALFALGLGALMAARARRRQENET